MRWGRPGRRPRLARLCRNREADGSSGSPLKTQLASGLREWAQLREAVVEAGGVNAAELSLRRVLRPSAGMELYPKVKLALAVEAHGMAPSFCSGWALYEAKGGCHTVSLDAAGTRGGPGYDERQQALSDAEDTFNDGLSVKVGLLTTTTVDTAFYEWYDHKGLQLSEGGRRAYVHCDLIQQRALLHFTHRRWYLALADLDVLDSVRPRYPGLQPTPALAWCRAVFIEWSASQQSGARRGATLAQASEAYAQCVELALREVPPFDLFVARKKKSLGLKLSAFSPLNAKPSVMAFYELPARDGSGLRPRGSSNFFDFGAEAAAAMRDIGHGAGAGGAPETVERLDDFLRWNGLDRLRRVVDDAGIEDLLPLLELTERELVTQVRTMLVLRVLLSVMLLFAAALVAVQ